MARKHGITAECIQRGLARLHGEVAPETFTAFIRDYRRHVMLSVEYEEPVLSPMVFFDDWIAAQTCLEEDADSSTELRRDYLRQFLR